MSNFVSKKLRRYLIVDQLVVNPLPQRVDAPKILLAKGKQIDAVGLFIDRFSAHFALFVEPARFQAAQKDAFLHTLQTELFAFFSDAIAHCNQLVPVS
jgi:hypothetical protein